MTDEIINLKRVTTIDAGCYKCMDKLLSRLYGEILANSTGIAETVGRKFNT